MNKKRNYIITGLTFILVAVGVISCDSQNDSEQLIQEVIENGPKTCNLVLNISKEDFDDIETRSATSWENGDMVYLIFSGKDSKTYGDAVYNDGKWQLTYYGTLNTVSGATCQAVYIENPTQESGADISFDYNSAVYEDTGAQYNFDGSQLEVVAALKPKTGRIRFTGNPGTFKLYGISYYDSFDSSTGSFQYTTEMIPMTVSGNTTQYVYGFCENASVPLINVIYTSSAFTRQLAPTIFQAGQSGYMNLPTEASHTGWRNRAIFNIKGVELVMIPVEYSEGNFLLAETETTEELVYAVTGTGSSSLLPKTYYSWTTFLRSLTSMTGIDFRYPTYNEWKWAFKGGNLSKGYIYSGSDDIYEVAWFTGNSYYRKQEVKLLKPNELGFYDMSGNVAEWTSDNHGWGGSVETSASYCAYSYDSYTSYYIDGNSCGVRLAISNN